MEVLIMLSKSFVSISSVCAAFIALSLPANAAPDIQGVWYDHEGRGAVEIKPCKSNASRLCGHVVYVKKARNKKRCGTQIIGNVKSNGWGWIYSPKRGRSFSLKVKRLSKDRLRIVGNASSRFFSKTFTWKRAPASVINCGQPAVTAAVAKKATAKPVKKTIVAPVVSTAKAKPSTKPTTARISETPANTETSSIDDPSDASTNGSPSTALMATTQPNDEPVVAEADEIAAEEETAEADSGGGDDLSPPGGLSKPKMSFANIENKIRKFVKRGGKGKGKCKYRIPYVGRTINVPCK
jgi:uncharacterized protein (DUF2147 family)